MNLLTLDEVIEEWKVDAVIDNILLDHSALKIPVLHQKYLQYLNEFKKQKRFVSRKKKDFPSVERRTSEVYKGIEELLAEQEDGIETCEKIIHAINGMSYNIGNIVKWRMFTQASDLG